MFRVIGVAKSYGDELILDHINFTLSAGERAGLIGPNGAGKTTLLRIIAGVESPDKGSVWIDPAARLGYLSQALVYAPGDTVGTVMQEAMGPALEAVAAIERLGAVREGLLRKTQVINGDYQRSSIVYSIVADEWPAVKANLERAQSGR